MDPRGRALPNRTHQQIRTGLGNIATGNHHAPAVHVPGSRVVPISSTETDEPLLSGNPVVGRRRSNRQDWVRTRPTIEFRTETLHGRPWRTSFRLLYNGDEAPQANFSTQIIAQQIQLQTARFVRTFYNWSDEHALVQVHGYVQADSLVNDRHFSSQQVRLGEVTDAMLGNIILEISGAASLPSDYEWTFTISPASIFVGAGTPTLPKWGVSAGFKSTWEEQTFEGRKLNCAAYAIALRMKTKETNHRPRGFNDIKRRAAVLMDQFGWDTKINFFQVLGFVNRYTEYRITIVLPLVMDQSAYTAIGQDHDENDSQSIIYLVWDPAQEHFGLCRSPCIPVAYHRGITRIRWCPKCSHCFNENCSCPDEEMPRKKLKQVTIKKPCNYCGVIGCKAGACFRNCKLCGVVFKGGYDRENGEGHRCIIMNDSPIKEFWKPGMPESTSARAGTYMLWAYDLECAVERSVTEETLSFPVGNDNTFVMEDTEIVCVHVKRAYHKPNLVVFRNVFDPNSEEVYFGEDAVERFVLKMISYNFGLNVAIAHNGAGYDSRLLFETLTKLNLISKLEPTTRGTKFLQLTVNKNTHFRDSLLHLPGSLANLAKDFGLTMRKGNFPHLFNTAANYDYEGPIPSKEYFDLSFSAKSSQDIIDFNEWHSTQTGAWNFKQELIKYCQDDVKILASLAEQFHDICVDRFSISPWFSATAPSYVHKVVIKSISSDEYLQLPDKDDAERRRYRLDQLAEKEHWAALLPAEYWFARKALRGGRTDARCLLKELTQEEVDRGCEIRYQDIVSMYPYVQVAYDYPVGIPKIKVYDDQYFPCRAHENPHEGNTTKKCSCPIQYRQEKVDKMLQVEMLPQPSQEYLKTFFGIICVSMKTPLNLFHPVLVVYDEGAFKCTAPLGNIVEGVFTSVEFQKALEKGYTVVKVHRIDEYNKRPGLWNDFIKTLYVEKMANSEPCPSVEEQSRLVEEYESKFGMGQAIQDSFPRWGRNSARRQVFKIMLNSGWGKHCQRLNMPFSKVINDNDQQELLTMFANFNENILKLNRITSVGNQVMISASRTSANKYNLHGGYLPAGLFVPSYGRLELYKHLEILDKRVLYHDTDSIVYVYDPLLENIPSSNIWGEWDEEKISRPPSRGGIGPITKFLALGPKSYAIQTGSGKELIKLKGFSVKHSHGNIISYETLRMLLKSQIPNLILPQMTFRYKYGIGIFTEFFKKELAFQPEILKGKLIGNLVYPHNYCEGCYDSNKEHVC